MAELDRQHQNEVEAKEAELESEEAGLVREMIDSSAGEHVALVKQAHRDILNVVSAHYLHSMFSVAHRDLLNILSAKIKF